MTVKIETNGLVDQGVVEEILKVVPSNHLKGLNKITISKRVNLPKCLPLGAHLGFMPGAYISRRDADGRWHGDVWIDFDDYATSDGPVDAWLAGLVLHEVAHHVAHNFTRIGHNAKTAVDVKKAKSRGNIFMLTFSQVGEEDKWVSSHTHTLFKKFLEQKTSHAGVDRDG